MHCTAPIRLVIATQLTDPLYPQPMRSSSYELMAPTQSQQQQLQRAPQGMPESSVLVLPLTPETQLQSTPQSQSALAADPSDLVFQFDSLSDFSDMIDLAELVATESDNPGAMTVPPPPIAGAIRRRRRPTGVSTTDMLLQKPVTAAVRRRTKSATAANIQAITATTPTATGNRRKRKVSPHVDESMAWERIEAAGSPPAQRYDCGLAISGSLLIVVGGIVGKDRLNDLHVLDVDECPAQWRRPVTRGSPPRPGSLLQTFVINETLYVIGGTKDGKFLTELHALDLSTWSFPYRNIRVWSSS